MTDRRWRTLIACGISIAMLAILFSSCSAGSPAHQAAVSREQNMKVYPKIFADYRQSSFQTQTTSAAGDQLWLTPNPDTSMANVPRVIAVAAAGLIVQYGDRFRMIGLDGTVKWEMTNDPGVPAFVADTAIYYRATNRFLQGVTFDKRTVLTDFAIPRCRDRGGVPMVQARGDNHFLIQTFNAAPEVIVDSPPEQPDYNLMLMGPDGLTDWDWMREFEGTALPALVTSDNVKAVLLNTTSLVTVFDIATGKTIDSFEVPKAGFLQASLDRRDRLVVALYGAKAQPQLDCYSLSGDLVWSCPLSPAERRAYRQPPAVDGDNRIAYIWGDTLLVVAEGTVLWRHAVPAGRFVPYVTVLGDNSLLLAAANALVHLDKDGVLLFETYLKPEVAITTPPVVDTAGRVYVGTTAGVHCFE
ncbi:MAG: hypothetical protein PHR28_04465 [candidate division Zixibacteria bacterium]|nr:hypothetical protein [candidate division Zixibacteria bacterium]